MDTTRQDPESCKSPPPPARRTRCSCKLTLLVALQTLLLTACLAGGLYVYWSGKSADVYIQFFEIPDVHDNTTLKLSRRIRHQSKMDVSPDEPTRILVECNGPYILYMYLCYKSVNGPASGTIKLEEVGSPEALLTFTLNTSSKDVVCRGLQNTVYLHKKNQAELKLYSTNDFRIKNIKVGFHYLLGSRCEY